MQFPSSLQAGQWLNSISLVQGRQPSGAVQICIHRVKGVNSHNDSESWRQDHKHCPGYYYYYYYYLLLLLLPAVTLTMHRTNELANCWVMNYRTNTLSGSDVRRERTDPGTDSGSGPIWVNRIGSDPVKIGPRSGANLPFRPIVCFI